MTPFSEHRLIHLVIQGAQRVSQRTTNQRIEEQNRQRLAARAQESLDMLTQKTDINAKGEVAIGQGASLNDSYQQAGSDFSAAQAAYRANPNAETANALNDATGRYESIASARNARVRIAADTTNAALRTPIVNLGHNPLTPAVPAKGDAIAANRQQRLESAGKTPDQISAVNEALPGRVSQVASNTGQGGSFDPAGNYVPPVRQLNQIPEGDHATIQDLHAAGYKNSTDIANATIETIDGVNYLVNPDGSRTKLPSDYGAQMKAADQAAAQAAADKAAADAVQKAKDEKSYASGSTPSTPDTPAPSVDPFLSSLPPGQQDMAKSVLGPIADYIGGANARAEDVLQQGFDQLAESDKTLGDYLQKQSDANDAIFARYDQYYKGTLQNQLDAADRQQAADERSLDYQQKKADMEFDQAIRDQVSKNLEDQKNQLIGLGVSNGWRASRQTASVITALKKGEDVLADLRSKKALNGEYFANKYLDIHDTYHTNVTTAYDKFTASTLALTDKASEAAKEVDKTVYNSKKDKDAAVKDMVNKFLGVYGDNAKLLATETSSYVKFAARQGLDAEKFEYQQKKDMFDDTMQYIDKFGTQNRAELSRREIRLGLPPGSLTNQKTLSELKKTGGAAGIGSADFQSIDQKWNYLKAVYPDKSSEEIARMIANEADYNNGSSASGKRKTAATVGYLNTVYGTLDQFTGSVNGPEGAASAASFLSTSINDKSFFLHPKGQTYVTDDGEDLPD